MLRDYVTITLTMAVFMLETLKLSKTSSMKTVCMFHKNEDFRYSSVFAFAAPQLAIDILLRRQVERI